MLYDYQETEKGIFVRLQPQNEDDQKFLKILARKKDATVDQVQDLVLIGTGWNDRGPRSEVRELSLKLN